MEILQSDIKWKIYFSKKSVWKKITIQLLNRQSGPC